MLLDNEALAAIDAELDALFEEYANALFVGDGKSLGLLEQTYITGRLAQVMGPDALREMSEEEVTRLAKEKIDRTEEDAARLRAAEAKARQFLEWVKNGLREKIRREITQADTKWQAELFLRDQSGNLQKSVWDSLRNSAAGKLVAEIGGVLSSFRRNVDSFMQTVMGEFFQLGQVTRLMRDALVYKVPRPTACIHCFRLHLETDGSYKMYRIRDVIGNSNIGLTSAEWQFTVGVVHPNCYCVLYEAGEDETPVAPDQLIEGFAAARAFGTNAREAVILAEARLRAARERLGVFEDLESGD